MTNVIAVTSLIASILLFVAGAVELVTSWTVNKSVRQAADSSATDSVKSMAAPDGTVVPQAGIDFKGQWEALASLATALKDLDRSTRFFLLSLAFLAVAAAIVGLADVADAVAAT